MDFFGWFIVFLIAAGILTLDRFTPLYINSFYVRLCFYVTAASLPVFWISWILFGFKAVRARIYIFMGVLLICIAKALLTWGGHWKTQNVLYRDREHPSHTIELQTRADWFAFGYKKKVVERCRLLPFFDCIHSIDTMKLPTDEWKRANPKANLSVQ